MSKKDYVPKNDEPLASLLIHVRDTLPTHFTALTLTAVTPEVVEHGLDAAFFRFILDQQQRLVAAGQQATNAKNRARDGDLANPGQAVDLAFPGAPAALPSPRLPGILPRFRKFVRFLRGRPGYVDAIGESLMIIGDEEVMPELSTMQPVISLRLMGGQVEVVWKKQKMDSLEIEVDRGAGAGWQFLTIDSTPNYIDTQAFPAAAAKWKYRAIYRLNDARVGLWSAVAEITVG